MEVTSEVEFGLQVGCGTSVEGLENGKDLVAL